MVYTLLMPYLDLRDLVHFYRLNKLSNAILNPTAPSSIHFEVLFKMQNMKLDEASFKQIGNQERFTDVMTIVT